MFPGNITALFFNFNKIILLFQKSEGKYSESCKTKWFLKFPNCKQFNSLHLVIIEIYIPLLISHKIQSWAVQLT